MKYILYLFILPFAAMFSACSSDGSVDEDLRAAEMSIANGDMQAAESVVRHLAGSEHFSELDTKQLARLSLIYMQMADSLDREDNVGLAANCYRMAYEANSDSASEFYATLSPEHMPYAMMLRALVQPRDTSLGFEVNELVPADSLSADSLLIN